MKRVLPAWQQASRRCFSTTQIRHRIEQVQSLRARLAPSYRETIHHDLLALQWSGPPRNVLIVCKDGSKTVDGAFNELVHHVQSTYPDVNVILEPKLAVTQHEALDSPIFSDISDSSRAPTARLQDKVDLIVTLGGDGTILHASSLFATAEVVPPILSFSMGTLGFLGEWKFSEYKRAFREVYMSGAGAGPLSSVLGLSDATAAAAKKAQEKKTPDSAKTLSGWSSVRGKSMGHARGARVLLRNRLRVGLFASDGSRIPHDDPSAVTPVDDVSDVYAMNEVLLHRGRTPHLSQIQIYVGGRFLTEAVADGMLISTPTGSTAYSLSSGGSIVHPLVSSLLLTPICPRSLSFRPLVLPANTPITLKISEKNRSEEVEVSIDGVRRGKGLGRGMEVRVVGEDIKTADGQWKGGVPSIVRAGGSGGYEGEDHWVGGLNGLLKFNYPFGEDG